MKIRMVIRVGLRTIEDITFYGVDAGSFISGEVKSEPPTLGELSRRLRNSPDGFVSLRDRDVDNTPTDAAFERETTITLSDGDTLVRIWTSQHHVIQHLRKDKRFTETTDPSRCTTEEAEFTIPRTEWTPWGGAKHRRQLTDEQQIMEQVAADIWEYWPFRRTARYREAACHSTGEYRQAPRIRRRTRPDHLSRKRPPL